VLSYCCKPADLSGGLERQDVTFKVFQFPPNMIPRIDGNADDWAMVPDSYAIGMDQLEDDELPGQAACTLATRKTST
jgi:hypothetical protein